MGSYYLSVCRIGFEGVLKIMKGSAKLDVIFLYLSIFLLSMYFIISIPTAPAAIVVVGMIAGIILPALTLN